MEIDQEIFNMMLAKSMHQIARIEFRNSKFPYARGLCPLATPARELCPLDPPLLVNNLAPLSSGWIRPCSNFEGIFLICEYDFSPPKVHPAGGCFELQKLYMLYGASRVFVLKSSKSQDILAENWMFYTKWRFLATPTHPPLCIYW